MTKRGRDGEDDGTVGVMSDAMRGILAKEEGPQAKLEPEAIVEIVKEMQAHPGDPKERARVFSDSHPQLMEQCPALFMKACKPGLDMNMLMFMVNTFRESGSDESGGKVGESLMEQFVKPALSGS